MVSGQGDPLVVIRCIRDLATLQSWLSPTKAHLQSTIALYPYSPPLEFQIQVSGEAKTSQYWDLQGHQRVQCRANNLTQKWPVTDLALNGFSIHLSCVIFRYFAITSNESFGLGLGLSNPFKTNAYLNRFKTQIHSYLEAKEKGKDKW